MKTKTMGRKNSTKQKNTKSPLAARKANRDLGAHAKRMIGILEVSKSGMGFVVPPESVGKKNSDIRVSANNFNTAIHGDEVEVAITKIGISTGRLEGKIIAVVKRNTSTVVARLEQFGKNAFAIPTSSKINTDFYIPFEDFNGAQEGDKILIGNIKWFGAKKKPEAKVLEVITGVRASDIAMKELLLEAGFALEFTKEAYAEMEKLNDTISDDLISSRQDFRSTLTFTIDPVDAKDFDDAISYKQLENGNYEIGIHIADVSHYVQPNTTLDAEAYARATSVYLPDRVNPMLPEKISNELCSLRPNEDKLCFSAVFEIDAKAQVKKYWLGRTVIHSVRRYTYEEAQEILEGTSGDYEQELRAIHGITKQLRAARFKEGAIDFSSEEVRFDLDDQGVPIGIKLKVSKEANQLIEELMLLANRTVALHVFEHKVKNKQVPFPYRIHDTPDPEKLRTFTAFASKYKHRFDLTDGRSIASSFNKMITNSIGKPEKAVLESLSIRTMAKAEYATQNIGHYGLAFEYYCHFTSPIRRYPDVLVHRVLQEVLDNEAQLDPKMQDKCAHCSERERAAMSTERDANKYKQCEYMSKYIGQEFEGVIVGIAHFGFWVETKLHKCEGLVSFSNLLHYDIFKHIPEDFCAIGQRTKTKFVMGDTVKVLVAGVSVESLEIDFELID
jgi:ribonuclease R